MKLSIDNNTMATDLLTFYQFWVIRYVPSYFFYSMSLYISINSRLLLKVWNYFWHLIIDVYIIIYARGIHFYVPILNRLHFAYQFSTFRLCLAFQYSFSSSSISWASIVGGLTPLAKFLPLVRSTSIIVVFMRIFDSISPIPFPCLAPLAETTDSVRTCESRFSPYVSSCTAPIGPFTTPPRCPLLFKLLLLLL